MGTSDVMAFLSTMNDPRDATKRHKQMVGLVGVMLEQSVEV